MALAIPKIVMQTWKNHTIPQKWQSSPLSLQQYMPDWQYILMTDEDNRKFVQHYFPDFLPFFDKFPYPIQRADAIRPMFLYIHGGIYMDMDFEVQQSLAPLFTLPNKFTNPLSNNDLFFVASGNMGSWITNSFMASKPRHPFWLYYIERMKRPPPFWAINKHFKIMTTTGPMALTWALRDFKTQYTSLPKHLIMPCSVCNIDRCDTSQALLKPLEGQSWNSLDSKILNYILCNWKTILFLLFLLIILFLIIIFFIYKRSRKPK